MKKILYTLVTLFLISSVAEAVVGIEGGGGALRRLDLGDDSKELQGVEGGGGSFSTIQILEVENLGAGIKDLKVVNTGDYDFDSLSNRWYLKTRSRLLSVKKLELIDKYEEKQNEITNYSIDMKSRKRNLNTKFLKTMIKRNIKFREYIVDDFEY